MAVDGDADAGVRAARPARHVIYYHFYSFRRTSTLRWQQFSLDSSRS
jgi:hypothetical protein